MKQLTPQDFKPIKVNGSTYFSCMLEDGREVCIEPCMNGYDVAIYRDTELIGKKICTDVKLLESETVDGTVFLYVAAAKKAIDIANKLIGEDNYGKQ
jgi:hypothetical protein